MEGKQLEMVIRDGALVMLEPKYCARCSVTEIPDEADYCRSCRPGYPPKKPPLYERKL
jgi:hypothetical protein